MISRKLQSSYGIFQVISSNKEFCQLRKSNKPYYLNFKRYVFNFGLGHERFGGMTRVYYKYAHGALIVFDLARPETFDAALSWLSDVTEKLFDEKKELLAGKKLYVQRKAYL